MINNYERGQQGNGYDVFEISDAGLKEKSYPPFNYVDNMMKFDVQNKIITYHTHDGSYYSCSLHYQKIDSTSKQNMSIPENLDDKLKNSLSNIETNIPSDFQIVAADITINENKYLLKVDSGKWILAE